MRNEGNTAYPENTRVQFIGGDKISLIESFPVPQVPAGKEFDITVNVVAPLKLGRYVSYWRLVTSDGTRFGQRMWVDIEVVADPESQVPKIVAQVPKIITPVPNTSPIVTRSVTSVDESLT